MLFRSVFHAMLDVGYVTKQKVSRSFVFLSQISYSDSDSVSLFGNFTMRAQVTLNDIHFLRLDFTSPPHKLSPAPASHGRVFATRTPTIASKAATSRLKASFPSHQHRRYYQRHHHHLHQSPCLAIPPTSWAQYSCGYASAYSPP